VFPDGLGRGNNFIPEMESLPYFPSLKKAWCDLRNPNGEICNKACSNSWNMKRHKQSQHGDQLAPEVTFVHHEFDRDGVTLSRTHFRPQELQQHLPTRFIPSSILEIAAAELLSIQQLDRLEGYATHIGHSLTSREGTRLGSVSPTAVAHFTLTRETRAAVVDHCQPRDNTSCTASESTSGTHTEVSREEHGKPESHKRKQGYGKDPYPIYDVKRSRKQPQQQRAIDWLKSDAKVRFDEHYTSLLGQWGVKSGHWGTCILSTAQWQALDPVKLASTFAYSTCPEAKSDRLVQP
jgi:hypothetical protein